MGCKPVLKILILAFLIFFNTTLYAQKISYVNQTDFGLLVGDGTYPSPSAQLFNGVKFAKWNLETGITCGVDNYSQIILLPVSVTVKWNPLNQREISPYISLTGGYAFDWLQRTVANQSFKGGLMTNPCLGLRIKTKKTTAVNLGLGYRQQRATVKTSYSNGRVGEFSPYSKDEHKFSRLALSVGLSF